ncbi:MAG TPA: PHP domain-containing protein, partial [Anaerolineae bacterium]
MTEPYAELHCHSYFTLLDAASSPEALVARAKELQLSALAQTDRDSMAGAVRFWVAAKETQGPRAILGAELSLAPLSPADPSTRLILLAESQQGYANLCRLITRGYLGAEADAARLPYKPDDPWLGKTPPRAAWETLNENRAGLIALSGGRDGPVAAPLTMHQPERARAAAQRLRDIFGPRQLWIELQQHYRPDSDSLIRRELEIAAELGLPYVATNGVHYATREESRLRDAMLAIDQNITLTEARQAGLLPMNSNAHLVSPDEMAQRFGQLPQALRATAVIAERCRAVLDFGTHRMPEFVVPGGGSEFEYLYKLCHDRLPQRYDRLSPAVLKQLAHELDVIEQAGLAGYFLIVWDLVRFSRENGIRCQGRGSAANSIVAYLLGITSIDPLQHHLLFERFLSPDRHTMPDIDIDFAADRREEVIQYVYSTYGQEHTAMVCNWVTYHARSALRDLGKVLGFPTPVIDQLSASLDTNSATRAADAFLQQMGDEVGADAGMPGTTAGGTMSSAAPDGKPLTGKAAMDAYIWMPARVPAPTMFPQAGDSNAGSATDGSTPGGTHDGTRFSRQMDGGSVDHGASVDSAGCATTGDTHDKTVSGTSGGTYDGTTDGTQAAHPMRLLAELMRLMDGCPRHLSIHVGGMLITGPPLDQVVPLERATMPGRVICQWNKDSVEDAGLIKIDVLGLRTLGLVTEALGYIDEPPDLDRLPLDDPDIYTMLQRADTIGTFQVESRAQQQMLPRLAPKNFEDIIVQVSIVRPGPIQGGSVHPYLRRRNGLEPVTYAHPQLEIALKETLGVLLFQEQAIRMAVLIAAFTPGEADALRRALSRFGGGELTPKLKELGNRFLIGAARNGIDSTSAEAAFKQLAGFAGYGLCKSHAASFALIAYQTCWLKQYHPAPFYCALLNQQPMGFYSPEVIIGDM